MVEQSFGMYMYNICIHVLLYGFLVMHWQERKKMKKEVGQK